MAKQVWECKGAHKFRYETPIAITEFMCPQKHMGILVEGDPVVLKPKKKRAKIQKVTKVVDKRNEVEKAIDKLKRTDGKVVATKVSLF